MILNYRGCQITSPAIWYVQQILLKPRGGGEVIVNMCPDLGFTLEEGPPPFEVLLTHAVTT